MIATGKLTTTVESKDLKISTSDDVTALGLGRGAELILLQLVSFQREMNDRLDSIEARLDAMEGVEDESEYSDWGGFGDDP